MMLGQLFKNWSYRKPKTTFATCQCSNSRRKIEIFRLQGNSNCKCRQVVNLIRKLTINFRVVVRSTSTQFLSIAQSVEALQLICCWWESFLKWVVIFCQYIFRVNAAFWEYFLKLMLRRMITVNFLWCQLYFADSKQLHYTFSIVR